MSTPVIIDAFVHPCEQPALRCAADRLAMQLGRDEWPVRVRFSGRGMPALPGALVVASLLADVQDHAVPLPAVGQAWRGWLAGLTGHAGLFLCTAFRVADPGPAQARTAERTRRLNRLAAELSRETGGYIIDIDRAFGLLGARAIQAAGTADAAAGHVIARCLLSAGLDGIVPDAVLAQARARSPESGLLAA